MLILQRCGVTTFWQNLCLVKFLDNHFGVGVRGAHLVLVGGLLNVLSCKSHLGIPNTTSEAISSFYEPLLSTPFCNERHFAQQI